MHTNTFSNLARHLVPSVPRPDWWRGSVLLITLILALPVLVIFSFIFTPSGEVWRHLADTVLASYVTNSLLLVVGVAIGTLLIGVSTAWVVTATVFPGRRIFEWALLLPMAMPAYIIAYTYTGMLDFAGPLQSTLREWFDWGYGDYWFPDIRSLWGAMLMLTLVLYPYVYLLARAAFLEQSVYVLDVGRSLGFGPWRVLFRIALPLARPAIITGLSLALMETLADFGTVQYFGIDTFTTGIYRTWLGLGDSAAAAQLSAMLLIFVFTLVVVERWSRRQAQYHNSSRSFKPVPPIRLTRARATVAFLVCLFPLLLGFILPALQLLSWSIDTAADVVDASFFGLILNSLSLAMGASVIALTIALLMAYAKRLRGNALLNIAVRIAAMGYAIPGTVLAVGVMIPFAWIDNSIDGWMREQFDVSTGLILSGTVVALLFAYTVRFLSVSVQTVEAGLGKIRLSMDDAGRSLGYTPGRVLRDIHLPIMRTSLLTALLMVFVDVLKELPATLMLRPFNFNTLAVRAYELAGDERLADAASAALSIVLVGIIPVILLSRSISRKRPGEEYVAQA
ncbi:MAG: iron ABC transporter permease [Gammaproteobacteria bacterium]|nr:iron ABC transporter permease [Gammaproteobacteria bacterium]